MKHLNLLLDHTRLFVSEEELEQLKEETCSALKMLEEGRGEGNDFTGWLDLPSSVPPELIAGIMETAEMMRQKIDCLVVIGIGGSYLGAKAVISALSHQFGPYLPTCHDPLVLFAGHNIGEDYLSELLEILEHKDYGIVVISKSGTTTEPAMAFRILKNHLERKYGPDEALHRIVAITDREQGALRNLAVQSGYRTFTIPDDTGGRYSVLTPVGLVPLAIAGINIEQLLEGARQLEETTSGRIPFGKNPSALYAATRNLLYRKGRKIEILANYDNRLTCFSEWWKQLFGESEGKNRKGIFPASVTYTTDLHSMGQYIQDGERILFETIISIRKQKNRLEIPRDPENLDSLNFLAGKRMDQVNRMAELGTILAHVDGGVPNIVVEIPELNAYHLGGLIYFFEKACGISGYMLGVNPFNQPGVEAYKSNMFALLGKPGFEEETRRIKAQHGRRV